ncbi:MAG TPA: GDP-L-fucose synthase [Marinilabiliales bacterium]|nr:MAG: GDP-fucose synthetase [Bacteroidetes bacterium GWA2_40_14]OFX57556.1 MAG: GDP-fucose synthetase [Bacteroidetes bacterium GWC2_40_13]OFX73227.1 MAG: GDP-fucose synthetase [Bacteroidetes bacterium GWD2_40_43]OFX92082.1 MAG: GDP-fucose synthetase [Bacteroidetes bacterium GWE2_40_63]OFY16706.1 MAG: GDP-fucose synthetase [Bacteroidetes bacterium GWF2_40_13]OFZ30602.1 MAG: GDP-fucose synthetase [Bacteroidetes bacterium RIFOXYC2_FULL_40_12]HAM98925.1 GDP-L-fucose synthase [Marinilabiliales b
MEKDSKIYIAGHKGMVGSAIMREMQKLGYHNLVYRGFGELDLTNQQAVAEFFAAEKPEYVVLAAAKVGGIVANNIYRAQFIYENLMIQNNIIHHAYLNGVKKLLFLGSSCIYPKLAPQPLKEEYLLTNDLEYTNEPYAIAKIAGIKMCESYNIQYGTNFISVMPTNLYGPNDNYDLEKSHVLPALIRKMHIGKCLMNNDWGALRADLNKLPIEGVSGETSESAILDKLAKYGITKKTETGDLNRVSVTLWGTGSPFREFLYVEDLAEACVYCLQHVEFKQLIEPVSQSQKSEEIKNTHINIGTGKDLTIKELAEKVKHIVGFEGELTWDRAKPDGTPKKLLDVSKIHQLGWKEKVGLDEGIGRVYRNYKK